MQTFENLLRQNYSQNSKILHINSPWVCVIKVCSNGGTTYIIGEIISKDNLNIENLILHINRPWVCAIKVCSNGGATYIIC